HLENVWADLEDDPSAEDVAAMMEEYPSADLPSSPDPLIHVFEDPERPQPRMDRMLGDGMAVAAGGIEETPGGVQYNCLAHNTIRGAAGASVLNGELLLEEGYL
ncbi:MAG: aspartate-semialdehyde dehydrogenase, partial [Natronomonas sp.]